MSWLWIVPVLGILVVIHELGHFVSARMLGIRVEEFGIGFPPRAVRLFRAGGTDYTLNWLPIGGFVRILGENGESAAPDSFAVQPAWKRIIVLAAGSAMNVLMALILLIAIGIIGDQPIFGKECVYSLAVGHGRNRGRVIQRVRRLDAGAIHRTLP